MRMKGNRVSIAKKLIKESGLEMKWFDTAEDAVKSAIKRAK